MKRLPKRIFAAGAVLLLLLLCASAGIADAGSFSGDSDWGGSSDWSSGSDWGSSDWGSSDWGSSGWNSAADGLSVSSGVSEGDFSAIGTAVVVTIIVLIVIRNMRKSKTSAASRRYTAQQDNTPGLPLSELTAKDPDFNAHALCERIGNLYLQMQDAWEKKNWEPMRASMTDALFNQMGRQLDELAQKGLTNYVDRIAVLSVFIRKYAIEGNDDVLIVRLNTRICDYTVKDTTDEIVSGSKTRELFMTYDWKMIRQKDRKTLPETAMTSVNCPNCGAPMSICRTGKCEYCGTVVTLSDHDWVLSSITGISQQSK